MMPTTARPAVATALAFAFLLAGCAGTTPASTLEIDFGGTPASITATVHPEGTPSAPRYQAVGATHPGFYSAFDQLVQWSQDDGHTIDVEHASFGFFLCGIDGQPGRGANAYWSLLVNGTESQVGMDQVRIADGSTVTWRLTESTFPNCPQESTADDASGAGAGTMSADGAPGDAPTLAAPERVVVRAEQATITGTGTPGLELSIAVGDAAEARPVTVAQDGSWAATVAPAPGQTEVTVTALGTSTLVQARVLVVREVQVTLEARFNGFGTDRSDAVWLDVDAALSAPQYADRDLSHPGHGTVHDAMVAWAEQAGAEVDYAYSNGLGYSVSRIDGVGSPVDSGLLSSAWCYTLNGESADLGISAQPVAAGDVVTWSLGCVV